MLSAALLLFANTLLLSLRLSGGGSFPKPLTAAEEREWLRRYARGMKRKEAKPLIPGGKSSILCWNGGTAHEETNAHTFRNPDAVAGSAGRLRRESQ